jgi:phospholipid-translocating ATPase
MCAVGDHILQKRYYPENAYWLYGANTRGDNPNINGLISFANAMITFQNIVPISLYISIEFVRTVQALYIWGDDEIKYMLTGRRTIARSWNLSDDLGQIEYIFSDKTGTLTQNSMQFRHCTIGGKAYMGDDKLPDNTIIPEKNLRAPGAGASVEQSKRQDDLENQELASRSNASSSGDETRVGGKHNSSSSKENENEPKQVVLPTEVVAPFHDDSIDRDLKNGGKQEERIRMFFHNLSLCHTVLAAEDGEGHIEYKAQSPDEAALVQAAADVGFVFRGRDREILKLQLPGSDTLHKFELLETLEFTSARKRMSVLLRRIEPRDEKDNKIILFSKGADNVIFERLVPGDEEFKKKTDTHLEEFASEGRFWSYLVMHIRSTADTVDTEQVCVLSPWLTSIFLKRITKLGQDDIIKLLCSSTAEMQRSKRYLLKLKETCTC